MKYRLEVQPEAEYDISQAYDWYEGQHEGLGDFFLKELDSYFRKLETNPDIFSKVHKTYRQAALKQFPFVLIYEIVRTKVVLYAVFHTSRNPKQKFKRR